MMRDIDKYDYRPDYSGGATRVNLDTGEVDDRAVAFYGPEGSIMYTPAQQGARKRWAERNEASIKEAYEQKLGAQERELEALRARVYRRGSESSHFMFSSSSCDWYGISPESIARSVLLGTYVAYDSDALQLTERSPMTVQSLDDVLLLSRATRNRFWAEVSGRIFTSDEMGQIHIRDKRFFRGHLSAQRDVEYQRIYISALRELYRKARVRQHSKLGYVFQMLPFINFEYNILCENPNERDSSKVLPITVSDFCTGVGHNSDTVHRLVSDYKRICFTVDGRDEQFCKFLSDGSGVENGHIYINPRVIYKGSDPGKVEALGISFAAPSDICEQTH